MLSHLRHLPRTTPLEVTRLARKLDRSLEVRVARLCLAVHVLRELCSSLPQNSKEQDKVRGGAGRSASAAAPPAATLRSCRRRRQFANRISLTPRLFGLPKASLCSWALSQVNSQACGARKGANDLVLLLAGTSLSLELSPLCFTERCAKRRAKTAMTECARRRREPAFEGPSLREVVQSAGGATRAQAAARAALDRASLRWLGLGASRSARPDSSDSTSRRLVAPSPRSFGLVPRCRAGEEPGCCNLEQTGRLQRE